MGFKVQIYGMQRYLIPCTVVIKIINPMCANARFGTITIEISLDGVLVPL
jgi:hypothetical protein